MKFVLDQGLPRSTVYHLAAAGIASVHVGDLGMATATDAEILEYAAQQQAVVVTLDADFHQALALSHANYPSVIRIRIEGLKGDRLSTILIRVIAAAERDLSAGAVVSVTRGKIRVRSLPIGR